MNQYLIWFYLSLKVDTTQRSTAVHRCKTLTFQREWRSLRILLLVPFTPVWFLFIFSFHFKDSLEVFGRRPNWSSASSCDRSCTQPWMFIISWLKLKWWLWHFRLVFPPVLFGPHTLICWFSQTFQLVFLNESGHVHLNINDSWVSLLQACAMLLVVLRLLVCWT